jgi:hypothetical protein
MTRADRAFYALWAASTLARLALAARPQLKYEEAYYWNYSQHPDLSYFDHPPLLAWLIGLSSRAGADELWVRLPTVLMFSASLWLVWRLARQMFGSSAALAAALLMSVLPVFSIFSLFVMPDGPLLLFWCLGMFCGWRMVASDDTRWWWGVGLAAGLGMLSKYPGAFIPAGPLLFAALARPRLLRSGHLMGAALLAVLLISPVLAWNAGHGWASFRFQGLERLGQATALSERLGSLAFQLGLVTPPAFAALLWALARGWQRRRDERVLYLLCWSLPFLVLCLLVASRRLVQINWPMPGYVGAAILLGAFLVESWQRSARRAWLAAAAVLALPLAATALFLLWTILTPFSFLHRYDEFHGWSEMGRRAAQIRATMERPQRTFLAGHGYQAASELAFYAGDPALTLANNVLGERALSYDYWRPAADLRGWDAVYVVYAEPTRGGRWRQRVGLDVEALRRCFERVEGPEEQVVERGGRPLRQYLFYRCYGYKGPLGGKP